MAKEKKEKKSKVEKMEVDSPKKTESPVKKQQKEQEEVSYEDRVLNVVSIANPLANKKLTKKLYKVVKKAAKTKVIKRGVKEVVKGVRKGSKGVVVIAGDIHPIDVVSHIPVLCEEHKIPYVYVPSREDLGQAGSTKRATSCVMVVSNDKKKPQDADLKALYEEVYAEVKPLNEKVIVA